MRIEQLQPNYMARAREQNETYDWKADERQRKRAWAEEVARSRGEIDEALTAAGAYPGTETAARALAFVIDHAPEIEQMPLASSALDELCRSHMDSPVWADVASDLDYLTPREAFAARVESLRHELMENSPHPGVRSAMMLVLGCRLASESDKTSMAQGISLLRRIGAEFAQVEEASEKVCSAKRALFQLEHLQLGMRCPDFEVSDENGVSFRLSDYLGRTVLLEFGGYWTGLEQSTLAYEKKLLQRFAGMPFALISLNTDAEDAARLAARFKADGLDWRHGMLGPLKDSDLAALWNIFSFPTFFVIDAEGVIRNRFDGEPDESAIDWRVGGWIQRPKAR